MNVAASTRGLLSAAPILGLSLLAAPWAETAPARVQPGIAPAKPPEGPGLIARMSAFRTDVPAHPFDMILVSPTRDSIGLSVLAYADMEGYVEVVGGPRPDPTRTATRELKAGEPVLFVLSDLLADSGYSYRLWTREKPAEGRGGDAEFTPSERRSFRTPRAPGSSFVLTIVADSHLDAPMSPAVYERTLADALAEAPDFHIDLGDTFMTDKRGRDFKAALPQYIAQRWYLGKLCASAPLFMVLGNHDGEWGYARGDADAMAPWSFAQRTKYFPPPEIREGAMGGAMYSGCTTYAKGQGAHYYEFTWGDAQFIMLDPFWFTNTKARGPRGGGGGGGGGGRERREPDGGPAPDADVAPTDQSWAMTLGRPQYDWLARTLAASRSRHKFVFIHHLVGGFGRASRGGAAAAGSFEWGGKNADGSDGFAAQRPGWPMPIHRLLVEHRVSAVFHGHDHLYVHERLDGIDYQCVPQPGNSNGGTRSAAEYGYRDGVILGSPGHLRLSVSPTAAKVELIRTSSVDPSRKTDQPAERAVVDSYEIPARPATPK